MILVQSVSKLYRLYQKPSDRIREALPFSPSKLHTDFWALRDVSLHVHPGETLGLIGPNGSGKSTLLQIVSGILHPTSGRISTEGRIAALLELGAGFNPDFTGRENVYLNGEIMGLSRIEMERAFPRIEGFAEIGEFMERPVKEYSSGMYVRLAFSTAIHVDPDILIVDEALAVGDAIFSSRCVAKFEELKQKGVTVLFVTHDLGLVKQLADRAILMLNGRIAAEGLPSDVVNRYVGLVLNRKGERPAAATETKSLASSFRHGDGASRILGVELRRAGGQKTTSLETGEEAAIHIRARFEQDTEDPVIGILVRNRHGVDVFGTNTRIEGQRLGAFRKGETLTVRFCFHCYLTRQEYTLTVASQNWDGTSQDWLDDVLQFRVIDSKQRAGVVSLDVTVSWEKN